MLVSLQGIEAIHVDWQSGKRSALKISAKKARQMGLEPKSITAFMLGVESKITLFSLQRKINNHPNEPLQAIMPGSTLASLWQTMGQFEKVLMAVSVLVLFTGLMGLLTALLTTLNERRREMAVLRAVGAHAYHIIVLFVLEAILVVMGGFLFGIAMLYAMQAIMQPILADSYGIFLSLKMLDGEQIIILLVALLLAIILSLIPGLIAYKRSLQDGLMVKI